MIADVLLQIIWVAAHHGLRLGWAMLAEMFPAGVPRELMQQMVARWEEVHAITKELGNPPAPSGVAMSHRRETVSPCPSS